MATKEQIISEIQRIASQHGLPPGSQRFKSETGIGEHEWGRYWARWGDALAEAGFRPNRWIQALPEEYLLERLSALVRELGRFPVLREIKLKSLRDASFPSPGPFKRLGDQKTLASRLHAYSRERGYEDVAELCTKPYGTPKSVDSTERKSSGKLVTGFVYLMKSGRHYKIGHTISVGSRERQLAIKIPIPPKIIHKIETDDPIGVEAYWHKRFEQRRGEGEWFDLSAEDVRAFKRWKKLI